MGGGSYPTAEVQPVYSTAPADWATYKQINRKKPGPCLIVLWFEMTLDSTIFCRFYYINHAKINAREINKHKNFPKIQN